MMPACLLVSHGSRDPRPGVAMQQLAKLVMQQAQSLGSEIIVGTACLELNPESLHEQIIQFVRNSASCEKIALKVVPLFLLPGVHVMDDIPSEVALARQALGQDILIELQPYLGSRPGLEWLLAKQFATITATARIIIAHGSRRPGSQTPVEAIAKNLGAVTAYWSVPPSLEFQVKELMNLGHRQIAILPYFLFAGGITDAIAQVTEKLQLQSPDLDLQLAEPLGASAELADLIWDLIKE
ncbi:sirohydrochlorin chelatase [Pelatocladus sp. BLCC-F211]|uniref:sirohydrochlorin chelatase n=1 Tax=Pelatocladus sp. BLCC-F211 TaxID=3342752 RepID=UPI0035BA894A